MKKIIYAALSFAPVMAFADVNFGPINSLITNFGGVLNKIIPLLFALAIIYFFWGLVQFVRAAGDPKAQEAGKAHMIWGILALAVMVSVYGLINWLTTTAGLSSTTPPELPSIPTR